MKNRGLLMNEPDLTTSAAHRSDVFSEYPAAPFPPVAVDPKWWRNGIAVRMPNHLGDAVMALPALRSLRQWVKPPFGLFVIAPAGHEPLYRALGWVDFFVGLTCVHRQWKKREVASLRMLDAGIGVLFNNSLRDTVMMRFAGIHCLFGASRRGRGILLEHSFDFPRPHRGKLLKCHQSSLLAAMAEALGAPAWDGSLPEVMPVPAADEVTPRLAALIAHPKILAVAPGAAYGAAKRWPASEFRECARAWIKEGGFVMVLGASGEKEIAAETVETLPPGKVCNLAGETDLAALMVILSRARAVLCNDSGIMHLAAALGTPGVAVFGPTDDTATGPLGKGWILLNRRSVCAEAPCFSRVCPRGKACCIEAVTAADAVAALRSIV